MIDNLFTSTPWVWGSLIASMVLLPILIHLINLMRHKTVKWAAMEFLLKSHKKNRNWVWLKQLFLLLSRIAALVMALLMLAQIGCNEDRISKLLGGRTTHHYVLLDDSFSMSDRGSGGSAFDRAVSTLSLIGARARNRQGQLFSMLRYSMARPTNLTGIATGEDEASGADKNTALMGLLADINGELVDNRFDQRIESVKAQLEVSNLSVGLRGSLQTISELIKQREQENAIVYVLSDFREKDWANSAEVEPIMAEIHASGAAIELVNCAATQQPNLAITQLLPAGNVRVAGTPLMMQVTVKNCADTAAEKVQIMIGSLTFAAPSSESVPAEAYPDVGEIPTVFIESIAPGQSETRTFPVFFNVPGEHVVFASLPEDSIAIDNERWSCIEITNSAKVLVIDDSQQLHSGFLSLAMNPGGTTGIAPDIRTLDFLRDASFEVLASYDVIFLLDVETLEESAIKNVESFASAGGGVAFFVGPRANIAAYNESLYRNGEGIFPIPLDKQFVVPELVEDRIPDIAPVDHPIFAPVMGLKNSLLDLVQIKRVIRPSVEWSLGKSNPAASGPAEPANSAGLSVLATVRGNQDLPLVVEAGFGKGRVIAFTTTAGPIWNNWSRNATFPPILLLLEDYLAAGKFLTQDRFVGEQIDVEVAAERYTPGMTTLMPDGGDGTRLTGKSKLEVSPQSSERLVSSIGKLIPSEMRRETDFAGIYDVWLRLTDSSQEVRRYALNADTVESQMQLASSEKILGPLEASQPKLVSWDNFNPEPNQKPVSSLSRLLLILLVGVLITEQLLAYSASYHQR